MTGIATIQQIADRFDRIACAKCGESLDVSGVEPLTRVACPTCGTEQVVPARVGNFLLLGLLNSDRVSAVYEAYDRALGRRVAIKILQGEYSADPGFADDYLRAARVSAQINHPNAVKVFQVGTEKGHPYIVMELVAGGRLDAAIESTKRLDEAKVLKMALDVVKGLQAAASIPLVHGDVRPANIFVDKAGNAKLADFALGRFQARLDADQGGSGTVPHYVAPETVREQAEDLRTDVYGLGATMFHLLAGHPPFAGKKAGDIAAARLNRPAPSLSGIRVGLSPDTVGIVARMLEMDPARRYPNYSSLTADLQRALKQAGRGPAAGSASGRPTATSPKKKRGAGPVIGIVVAIVAVTGGVIAMRSGGNKADRPASGGDDVPLGAAPASGVQAVQPFAPADESAIVRGFELLGQGRDKEAVDAWLAWVKTAPTNHPGRPWLAVFVALPSWLKGDGDETLKWTKKLIEMKYAPAPDGTPNPAVLPQALARSMTEQSYTPPAAGASGSWPPWFDDAGAVVRAVLLSRAGREDEARSVLRDYLGKTGQAPAWPYALKPVAQRLLDSKVEPYRPPRSVESLLFAAKARASNVFYNRNDQYGPAKVVDDNTATRWATDEGTKSVWLEMEPGTSIRFSRIAIQEWSGDAPRVLAFEIKIRQGGEWKVVFKGDRIGPRFERTIEPVTAQAVRLEILDATKGPTIDEFKVFAY